MECNNYHDYKKHEYVNQKLKEERVDIYGNNYEDKTATKFRCYKTLLKYLVKNFIKFLDTNKVSKYQSTRHAQKFSPQNILT